MDTLTSAWPEPAFEMRAVSTRGTCSGTADVPDGQLAINVGGEIGDDVSGAIVGGTGKYEGAAGTFTSKSGEEGSKDTFDITLP